eukprot:scaffold632138_cov29-Prasinocladus_malaysianus.AAC.3
MAKGLLKTNLTRPRRSAQFQACHGQLHYPRLARALPATWQTVPPYSGLCSSVFLLWLAQTILCPYFQGVCSPILVIYR